MDRWHGLPHLKAGYLPPRKQAIKLTLMIHHTWRNLRVLNISLFIINIPSAHKKLSIMCEEYIYIIHGLMILSRKVLKILTDYIAYQSSWIDYKRLHRLIPLRGWLRKDQIILIKIQKEESYAKSAILRSKVTRRVITRTVRTRF